MDSELPISSVSFSKISQADFEKLIGSVSFYNSQNEISVAVTDLKNKFPGIDFQLHNDEHFIIEEGDYSLIQDLIVPAPLKLIIKAGTN